MAKKFENWYLGLDIGTNSIGWAATDTNYKVLRFNKRPMMGVHLFEDAQTAESRRANRTARRRLIRRRERIALLRSLFADEINKVDPNFFARLDDSNLWEDDKRENTRFSLFNDVGFSDKNFHAKYPTIYHLRYDMMTANNPDVRLVYLAFHNIIKYRGHFLLNGEDFSVVNDISAPFNTLGEYLEENHECTLDVALMEQFKSLLSETGSVTAKAGKYVELFNAKGNKRLKCLLEMIAGKCVSLKDFEFETEEELPKVDFKSANWEEDQDKLHSALGDDFILVEQAKLLYDYSKIQSILGNSQCLSQGMIAKYEKHKRDLKVFKAVVKEYFGKEDYNEMFSAKFSKCYNYAMYVGNATQKSDKYNDYEKFSKYVKQFLASNPATENDERVKQILADIDSECFLPRQVGKTNATLPYQLNLYELKAIINNVSKCASGAFLNAKDSDGITVAYKLEKLLTFRIPYYVGPLNNSSNKYWVVKREGTDGQKVYPWNWESIVDNAQSEEAFISRMTNDCPYFPGDKVLPKCSLLYEEFTLLNIINKIKINDCPLSVELKQRLSDYFKREKINKMSQKRLVSWLVEQGVVAKGSESDVTVTGIDNEFTANRNSYRNFAQILGSEQLVEDNYERIEEIISWITIAGSEKANLKKRLTAKCGDFLDDQQIKRIAGLTMSGWGRFGKRFLTERLGTDFNTGEVNCVSIMDVMRSQNVNLMEVLNSHADENDTFLDKINAQKQEETSNISYVDVENLYCSPAVKKQVWQTVSIAKELKKYLGEPSKIFVEMARGVDKDKARRDENNRTRTRYKNLEVLFANLKEQNDGFYNPKVAEEFNAADAKKLQNSKLYLYFMQNGIDIYTGERIDYNHLENYDKDHIYPRSKIKDDSLLNNMVLTYHERNVKKSDVFPVSADIQAKMQSTWEMLVKQGLITKEKYFRLTRKSELTAEECAEFVNKQITDTQQTTKEVATLLKRMFASSEIVYSKASNVSDFKNKPKYEFYEHTTKEQRTALSEPEFVKVRDINDLHHAKDAYLNIVVGNAFNTKFQHDARVYFAKNNIEKFDLIKLYNHQIEANGVVAWVPYRDGTISQVEKVMSSSAILFTRESRVVKGQLFNLTVLPKAPDLVPLKSSSKNRKFALMSDTSKYGGYNSETRAYLMLVQYKEKHETTKSVTYKTKFKFIGVMSRFVSTLTTNAARLQYCMRQYDLIEPKILIPCVKIGTLMSIDNSLLFLSGTSSKDRQLSFKLGKQCHWDGSSERYIKKVMNVTEKCAKNSNYYVNVYDDVDKKRNGILYDAIVEKLQSDDYKGVASFRSLSSKLSSDELKNKFANLSLTDQCGTLKEMLKLLKCDKETSNLKLLGEGEHCGSILVTNSFDCLDNICIINRSVTGMFEEKIVLSDLIVKEN